MTIYLDLFDRAFISCVIKYIFSSKCVFVSGYEKFQTNVRTNALECSVFVFYFHSKSFTATHEGRDVILFHHAIT